MNKETYDQTIINFHSQLLLQMLQDTSHIHPEVVDKKMKSYMESFNSTVAKPFLDSLSKETLKEVLDNYPSQFFNCQAGQDLLYKTAPVVAKEHFAQIDSRFRNREYLSEEESSYCTPEELKRKLHNEESKISTVFKEFAADLKNVFSLNKDAAIFLFESFLDNPKMKEFRSDVQGTFKNDIVTMLGSKMTQSTSDKLLFDQLYQVDQMHQYSQTVKENKRKPF